MLYFMINTICTLETVTNWTNNMTNSVRNAYYKWNTPKVISELSPFYRLVLSMAQRLLNVQTLDDAFVQLVTFAESMKVTIDYSNADSIVWSTCYGIIQSKIDPKLLDATWKGLITYLQKTFNGGQ